MFHWTEVVSILSPTGPLVAYSPLTLASLWPRRMFSLEAGEISFMYFSHISPGIMGIFLEISLPGPKFLRACGAASMIFKHRWPPRSREKRRFGRMRSLLFNRLQRRLGGGPLAAALSLPRRSPRPKAALGLLQSPTGRLDAVGAWPRPSARGHSGARGHTTQCFNR